MLGRLIGELAVPERMITRACGLLSLITGVCGLWSPPDPVAEIVTVDDLAPKGSCEGANAIVRSQVLPAGTTLVGQACDETEKPAPGVPKLGTS